MITKEEWMKRAGFEYLMKTEEYDIIHHKPSNKFKIVNKVTRKRKQLVFENKPTSLYNILKLIEKLNYDNIEKVFNNKLRIDSVYCHSIMCGSATRTITVRPLRI